MSSLVIEHFDMPPSPRARRVLGAANARAADELAGRTVWCATALPGGRPSARALRERLRGTGPGVSAAALEIATEGPVRRLAERLDRMLAGAPSSPAALRRADHDLYAEGAEGSDPLVGTGVGADDVVVVHDPLSALLAQAVRARGAHAVWRIRVREGSPEAAAREALDFLHDFTAGVDAYVLTWSEYGPRGERMERIAAVMPSAGLVMAKEIPVRLSGDEQRRVAWSTTLAEVVRGDRGECVGGTLHPRPAVAAR